MGAIDASRVERALALAAVFGCGCGGAAKAESAATVFVAPAPSSIASSSASPEADLEPEPGSERDLHRDIPECEQYFRIVHRCVGGPDNDVEGKEKARAEMRATIHDRNDRLRMARICKEMGEELERNPSCK